MYIFTEWPWETVSEIMKHITNRSADVEQAHQAVEQYHGEQPQRFSATCLLKWLVVTLLRLSFILAGMSLQLMTCFRRDLISNDLEQIPGTNTKRLSCDNKRQIVCGLIFPNIAMFLLALWVYVVLKFGRHINQCCLWLEWREMSIAMEANTAENLKELVEAIRPKLSKRLIMIYTAIPLCYIILSQSVSVGYLFAFQLGNEDIVVQTPLGGHDLAGDLKRWLIGLTFVGFISFDLLYITVEMSYVYRCQMITYYLQLMEHKVYQSQEEFREGVKKVRKFIKYLNASSGTTGVVTIIAVCQIANCTFILFSDEMTYPEAAAITARLILLGFLAIFPFHKAAGLNTAIKELHDTGLATEIKPRVFNDNPQDQENGLSRSNEGFPIILRAAMLGVTIRPWLPYLVILSTLLTVMIGAKFDKMLVVYQIKL